MQQRSTNFISISETLTRYRVYSLVNFPLYKCAQLGQVGNTFSFIGQAIKRRFITGERETEREREREREYYVTRAVFMPSPFDVVSANYPLCPFSPETLKRRDSLNQLTVLHHSRFTPMNSERTRVQSNLLTGSCHVRDVSPCNLPRSSEQFVRCNNPCREIN